ncbi:hypothetical protein EWM64_g4912 [Hericium alpestre]|uniref:Uncharacterized protein n=1 Tax=Hericium alpestre TaxID=135208 RepID=A0A4Y9ZYD4_9AGAM|nr:hypothetical protein EWM64_g4912 [Hericium alpestre]
MLELKPSPIYDPLPQHMIEDIRDKVAAHLVVRIVCKIKLVDDTKVSVALTLPKQDDMQFRVVAEHLQRTMVQKSYLFAIMMMGMGPIALLFCGSSWALAGTCACMASSGRHTIGNHDCLGSVCSHASSLPNEAWP